MGLFSVLELVVVETESECPIQIIFCEDGKRTCVECS